jgi:hypothetical protein
MTEYQNDFTWWLNALAGNRSAIEVNTPQPGFYRMKRKGNGTIEMVAIAYWTDSNTGELRCHLNGDDFDRYGLEIWPWASKNPVSKEDYDARLRDGKWPGEHAAVVGHNAAPPDDSPEAIAERIADLAREAEKMIEAGAAADQPSCDQASDLANLLGELAGKCEDLHAAEKRPILEAGRAIDRKWFVPRDLASALKARLKQIVVTPWLTKQKAEADRAAAAAVAQGAPIDTIATPKVTAGSSKRPTALRTYFRAEIEDRAKLLDHLKDHPDVIACIQKIANAAAAKKITLPGCRIESEQRAA